MGKNIILDSCYWFALYNEKDQYHREAATISKHLDYHTLLIPWPSLYETVNTKFVKNKWSDYFKIFIEEKNTVIKLLHDDEYKSSAINSVFNQTKSSTKYSLVDLVIREMLLDVKLNIHAIVTFNSPDFEDICWEKNIEMISTVSERKQKPLGNRKRR